MKPGNSRPVWGGPKLGGVPGLFGGQWVAPDDQEQKNFAGDEQREWPVLTDIHVVG
jgi:hypothetical protein